MRFALIQNDVVQRVIECGLEYIQGQPGEWADVTGIRCGSGYLRNAPDMYEAPPRPTHRVVLSMSEWTDTWTDEEWEDLQNAAYTPGFQYGGQAVPANVRQKLRKLFDAIKLTDSFNVVSSKANTFYAYLEDKGFIDAQRRAELQAGVPI